MPSVNDAETYMPYWLSARERQQMYEQLKTLGSLPYYSNDEVGKAWLQGDLLADFPYWHHEGAQMGMARAKVLVISNSCDIASDNRRSMAISMSVVPIYSSAALGSVFGSEGLSDVQINTKMDAIRKQEVASMFFLPASGNLKCDSVADFSRVQSTPFELAVESAPMRLEVLSQPGHWLLLVKLAIHFCRLRDEVRRGLGSPSGSPAAA